MKICFWISNYFVLGGTKRVLTLIANELVKDNKEITIMCGDNPFNENYKMYNLDERVKIDYIDMKEFYSKRLTPMYVFRYLMRKLNIYTNCFNNKLWCNFLVEMLFPKYTQNRFVSYFNSKDYDLIVGVGTNGRNLSYFAPRLRAKTLGWQHNSYSGYIDIKGKAYYHQEEILKRYLPNLDGYLVLSPYDKNTYMEKLGIETIVMINPQSFVSNAKINIKNKNFVAALRFVHQKGLDYLMESFKSFNEKNKEWKLIIVGDGVLFDEIVKMSKDYGIYNYIDFVGYSNNPIEYYLKSSVYLLSSRFEGWPMSVLEAFEVGMPVISYNHSSMNLMINDGENGFLVPPYDTKIFANKMLEIADNIKLREYMKEKAIEKSNEFKIENIMKQWNMLLEGLKKEEN